MTGWKLKTFAGVLGLVPLLVEPGFAQSTSRQAPFSVAVYSPGTVSCGLWLDARASKDANDVRITQLEAFVFGYATAYNSLVPGPTVDGKRNVLHVDIYGQRAFLDQHCREHPTDMFVNAVSALLKHLDAPAR
jgi:hypothetical protein